MGKMAPADCLDGKMVQHKDNGSYPSTPYSEATELSLSLSLAPL